jgi:RNA polymerase sigma factor (sigma-70 family)
LFGNSPRRRHLTNPHTETLDNAIALRDGVASLTPKQREALELWAQGYTQEEIAAMLGIDQTSVRDRLEYAISKLRQSIFPE